MTITLGYKNIIVTSLFLERVETSVSVRQGDEGRRRTWGTAILTQNAVHIQGLTSSLTRGTQLAYCYSVDTCKYDFTMSLHFRLSTHVTRFRLSTRMNCFLLFSSNKYVYTGALTALSRVSNQHTGFHLDKQITCIGSSTIHIFN